MSAEAAGGLTLSDVSVAEVHTQYVDREIHRNHYLDTIPAGARARYLVSAGLRYGVIGAAMWGRPVARREDQERTLELTRFWTEDYTPKNTESYALSRMVRRLRNDGRFDRLIAYASTGQGHEGGIYKATNWIDLGIRDTHGGDGWENRRGRTNGDDSPKRKFLYYTNWRGWFWHSIGRRLPDDGAERFTQDADRRNAGGRAE